MASETATCYVHQSHIERRHPRMEQKEVYSQKFLTSKDLHVHPLWYNISCKEQKKTRFSFDISLIYIIFASNNILLFNL